MWPYQIIPVLESFRFYYFFDNAVDIGNVLIIIGTMIIVLLLEY